MAKGSKEILWIVAAVFLFLGIQKIVGDLSALALIAAALVIMWLLRGKKR